METFCGSPFWDNQLTWNTSRPDFTQCFQNTALVYVPCGFLWLFAPMDAMLMCYNKSKHIPWTILTIFKIVFALLLTAVALADMSFSLMQYSSGKLVNPAEYYGAFIKAMSFILVIVLVNYGRVKGVHTSGVLFIFWLLLVIEEIITYRSILLRIFGDDSPYSKTPDDLSFLLVTLSLPLVLAELILFCFADTKASATKASRLNGKECPEESCSFFSRLTFWWFNGMIMLGFKKPLVMFDMWTLSRDNSSEHIMKSFDKHWIPITAKAFGKSQDILTDASSYRHKKTDESEVKGETKISILVPLFKTFFWEFTLAGVMKLFASLLMFVSPLILNLLITFVSSDEPNWRGFFYAGTLFFSSMVESFFSNQYEYRIYRVGMRVRSAVTATVFRKVLVLSSSARRNFTVGEIVNLMAVDVQRILDWVLYVHYIWVCVLQISIALYMLYQQIGVSMFAGLGFMILLIPINGAVTVKMKTLQVGVMQEKDKRTKLMNEILGGIKILKLYAWEESFQERVSKIRQLEVKSMIKQAYLFSVTIFAFFSASFVVALCTFTTYVLIDSNNVLDANTAFVSLSLFNILRGPFAFLPMLFNYTALFVVSLRRLNKFFSCPELDPDCISCDRSEECPIIIENGTFTWDLESAPLLKNINISLRPGSLVAVVGTVGSGKSSLLSALLGDMEKVSGRVNISGRMAYVPQLAWIQNATLQKNILFTEALKERQYKGVLEACCLNSDLEVLPGGDLTEIGEKGINLSGGQKQRVSLARSVYSDADIYLLDDPLSAVDAHVSKDLFDNVIGPKGMLKNKTRILVSHRINVLPEVDTILVLNDGVISESGSYEELLERKGAFAEFLVHHISEQSQVESVTADDLQLIEDIAKKVGSETLLRQISHLSGGESDAGGAPSEAEKESGLIHRLSRQMSVASRQSLTLSPKSSISQDAKKDVPAVDKSKLTEAEVADVGAVKLSVYMDYSKACGLFSSIFLVLSFAVSFAFNIGTNIWLSEWSNDALDPQNAHNIPLRNLRLGLYGAIGTGEVVFLLFACLILSVCTLKASQYIHDKCLEHILEAPMSFFDTTPLGRIINRFSKDIDSMDNIIRNNLLMFFINAFAAIASFIVISLQDPIFLAAILPLGFVYYIVQKLYIATSRQLKRLESISRSPIYTHFSETVSGTSSIRAYGACDHFIQEFLGKVDTNNTSYFPSIVSARWMAIRLEFLGYIISFLAALFAVLNRDTLTAGLAGLSISYALRITLTLNMLVRSASDLETNIVSVERCLEYTTTPTEAPRKRPGTKPPPEWPSEGAIKLDNYSTRYREGLDLVLKNVSCEINPNEKVGIVGRTGAGKSSLTLCLFRLIEAANGRITIDGIDISKLGLYDLRSKLTIIPQDPVIFTGNLRMNLDPFSEHSDEEIWSALEQSHLKAYVTTLEKGLEHSIIEGGENLSVGQRQLLCLGRALLRKTKVLIMDEATAAVDMETDELIQSTIRAEFKDCTVLTIAHRLNTVMDYDRIIVLQNGEIVEFDSPGALLQNKSSIFYSMAKDAELI